MTFFGKQRVVALALALMVWAGAALAAGEQRLALVIGNAAYPQQPLKTPLNDARDVAAKLEALGFEVILATNASLKEMARAMTRFGERLRPGGVALFYYAGHGIQVRGRNFLIPVDADIRSEPAVRSESVDVDQLMEQVLAARVSIVILDACRNNPFESRFRGAAGGGLAQMDAPKGMLIAYATAPGKTAADGDGRNGLYTSALLKVIDSPGLPLEGLFKQVRIDVARLSDDAQIPWEASSLTGDFYFRPGEATAAAVATAAAARTPAQIEDALWESIRDQERGVLFEEYLRQYPQGRYAAPARVRLVALLDAQRTADEAAAWRSAEGGGVAALTAYLAQFPAGAHARQAKTRLAQLQTPLPPSEAAHWAQADAAGDAASLAAFLERFPNGRYAARAKSRLAALPKAPPRPQAGAVLRDCTHCPDMVVVPEGRFAMGSLAIDPSHFPNEGPRHEVLILKPFAIGRYEVTQAEWQATMGSNPSHFSACGERCPVDQVSRDEAQEFARQLSVRTGARYRLPSEAEWEYACRAARDTPFCGGEAADAVAWHGGNASAPKPVGARAANAFGLFDMSGNVAEWVADCWQADYIDAPADGSARRSGRCDAPVVRGGSWLSEAPYLRAAQRLRVSADAVRGINLGFRLVREID